jgi:hypothetical protein
MPGREFGDRRVSLVDSAWNQRMHRIDGARIHQRFLEMAYIEGDQPVVDRETQWYAGRPEEYISFGLQARR